MNTKTVTMPISSNNEWLQYYDQAMSPVEPGLAEPGSGPEKPVRRRSRASKRTPTTLLNADANNFRALVQQFTGCPSTDRFGFANRRGPVTLSFDLKTATPVAEPPQNRQRRRDPPPERQYDAVGHDQTQYYSSTYSSSVSRSEYNSHGFENSIASEISNGFVFMDDHELSVNDYASSMEYRMEI